VATDEDIDTAGVVTTSDAATGCALIVIDDAGANTVTVDAGANATVTTPALGLGAGDVVIAPLEVPSDAIAAAFAQARSAGARTILNPSPVAEVNHLLALTDVVLVNEHEAAALAGTTVVDVQTAPAGVAARLAGPGQVVVVTLGGDGVAAGGEGVGPVGDRRSVGVDGSVGSVRIHGRRVTPVDTTGAGDCFGGVLAAGLAEGLALAAALDRANRAAALAVTRLGTVPAMPDRAEVLATIATPDH
jgi:ribokinase